jgi:hypothetical protein
MATQRLTHDQRELEVLTDLEKHFPEFADYPLSWSKVPDGQDPPDFLARAPHGMIGLELIEWLDGKQMGPAKGRESQREANSGCHSGNRKSHLSNQSGQYHHCQCSRGAVSGDT